MVDVEMDGNFNILEHEEIIFNDSSVYESPNSQSVDSQESVFITGSSTHRPEPDEDCTLSPLSQYYSESHPGHSAHNKAYLNLPVPDDKSIKPVVVTLFNRMVKKKTITDVRNNNQESLKSVSDTKKKLVFAKNTGVKRKYADEDLKSKVTDPKRKVVEFDEVAHEEMNDDDVLKEAEDETEKGFESVDEEGSEVESDVSDDEDDYCPEVTEDDDDQPSSMERWERRNNLQPVVELYTLPENEPFISKFSYWWQQSGASSVTTNKDTSTVRHNTNHLFCNQDSFLNHSTAENPEFNLNRLVLFNSTLYLSVPSPIAWLSKVGGVGGQDQPSRRGEMLKAYQRLLCYISQCLHDHNFEGPEIQQKEAVAKHLKALDDMIKKKNLSSQFTKLYKQQKKKKTNMEDIVKPFEKENLHNCVTKWFQSNESNMLELEALGIYNTAMASQFIRDVDFNTECRLNITIKPI